MRNYAMAMAGAGLLIGALTLSAALAGAKVPAAAPPGETGGRSGTTGGDGAVPVVLIELETGAEALWPEGQTVRAAESGEIGASGDAAGPKGAAGASGDAAGPEGGTDRAQDAAGAETARASEDEAEAGPFWVALRVCADAPERLYLTDRDGGFLQQIVPDADGDAALGPVAPGLYGLSDESRPLGAFRLLANAALDGADGQLWTDGELLYLESFVPGAAELALSLGAPGLYSFRLQGEDGTFYRDLFVSERERPGPGGRWQRVLRFAGLPAGSYRLLCGDRLLVSLTVRAGVCARKSLEIGRPEP